MSNVFTLLLIEKFGSMTSSRKSRMMYSISVYAFFMGGLPIENHLGMAQRKCEGVFDYDTRRATNHNGISITVQ